jgi:hypothetical protein
VQPKSAKRAKREAQQAAERRKQQTTGSANETAPASNDAKDDSGETKK